MAARIRSKTLVRLSPSFSLYGWHDFERWHDFDPNLHIDDGKTNLNELISQSRLIVYSYDSTGLLELLSQNIPTVAFWDHGLEHLYADAIPYYNLLRDAGIIHFGYTSLATHINTNWDNILNWWFDKRTQNSRVQFCSRFSRTTSEPVNELKEFLILFENGNS